MASLGGPPGAPALIFVTHPVEEIGPAFTHALLLRAGRIEAAGTRREAFTSARLTASFEARVQLAEAGGRRAPALRSRERSLLPEGLSPKRRGMRGVFIPFLICLTALLDATAQDEPTAGPPIREVSPGIFEIGTIRLEQKARTVSFPATVNKAAKGDMLEYLLVNEHGQTHESLLLTAVQPSDLHFAMLLLGAKGGGQELNPAELGGGQINAEFLKHAPKLQGDAIRITAKWKSADGQERTTPIEDWILNLQTNKPMSRGSWLYTGSSFLEGRFRAQQEGCFGALVTYPPALINNPREGNAQDDIWAVNAKAIPPVETPLELTIHLETAVPDAPKK